MGNRKSFPPDVNESQVGLCSRPRGQPFIRFGLAAIKGVAVVAGRKAFLKARSEGGKFKTLADMCERVDSRTVQSQGARSA